MRNEAQFPISAVGCAWRRFMLSMKRMADLLGAGILIALLLLVLTGLALAVWLDSGRPILYKSRRHGRGGSSFSMYKFRTMVPDAEQRLQQIRHLNLAQGNQVKILNDPRCTRVGRLLRRTSLDELPNLLNVIRGEMSLIGPRPHTLDEYPVVTPELLARLEMRPGITGLWQVMARNSTAEAVRAFYDRRYITTWSLWLDLRIALRTPVVVLGCNGGTPETATAGVEYADGRESLPDSLEMGTGV